MPSSTKPCVAMNYKLVILIFSLFFFYGCTNRSNGDENYCPIVDTTIKSLPKSSIKKINIFFDASGSMMGFMPAAKPSSELQILIPDIISRLNLKYPNSITFYPIYNSSSPIKSLNVKDAGDRIIYGSLAQHGGDTYLPTMLNSIYKSYFSPDAVNIFISDCIYSPKENEKKQAEQATKEIRETIEPYAKDYFSSVFCLFSKFNKIANSPYYLIVFGKPENNHLIESIVIEAVDKKEQPFKQVNFGLKYNQPYYSVVPNTEHSPNCIPNACDNLHGAFGNVTIQNWNPSNDSISFWVGINLNDYPSYATTQAYLDSNLILSMQKGTAKILSITKSPPKKLDKDDKSISDSSSHFIYIQVSELEDYATSIQLALKFSTPTWIADLDQTATEFKREQTYGLVRMMKGFEEAYNQNEKSYFFKNVIVSLIKQ